MVLWKSADYLTCAEETPNLHHQWHLAAAVPVAAAAAVVAAATATATATATAVASGKLQ